MSDEPPDGAMHELAAALRRHYGAQLVAMRPVERSAHLEREDRADLEVVVVLADGAWQPARERGVIEKLSFDISTARDLYIRAWVVAQSHWEAPEQADHPALIAELKQQSSMLAFTD